VRVVWCGAGRDGFCALRVRVRLSGGDDDSQLCGWPVGV